MAASATSAPAPVAPVPSSDPVKLVDEGRGLDCAWVQSVLGLDAEVESATVTPWSDNGGSNASMSRVLVRVKGSETPVKLILKTTASGGEAGSRALALFREGLFFQEFAPQIADLVHLPRVYVSHADPEVGTKALLMEDLGECVETGLLFGPGTPLNIGRDLEDAVKRSGGMTPARVARAAFLSAARFHARFWRKTELADIAWLRGSAWCRGEGREAWQASQDAIRGMWAAGKKKIESGETPWWSPEVIALIDASISRASWDDHVARLRDQPWTLVHGDFHPANMMMEPAAEAGGEEASLDQAERDASRLVLLDMEVVGLGSGPQDLGQYAISHASPEDRRGFEEDALKLYHEELGRRGVDTEAFTLEECKREYVNGGMGRWVWLLAYIAGCPLNQLCEFLHNQVLAFAKDHGVTAENVVQPRA